MAYQILDVNQNVLETVDDIQGMVRNRVMRPMVCLR